MTDLGAHCYTDTAASALPAQPEPAAAQGPFADCVLCGRPTEYPVAQPGSTLCPVCEWQQAQRIACSG
jgi:hypothetical protein